MTAIMVVIVIVIVIVVVVVIVIVIVIVIVVVIVVVTVLVLVPMLLVQLHQPLVDLVLYFQVQGGLYYLTHLKKNQRLYFESQAPALDEV
ncbi:hypothetical protein K502DRAFT_324249 [Neoconidiobolus thromboides FSU 785]|nr:hypothetical protein K502DRAFT_324249 [Neoconidiobolus thromboides FSU 785]